MIRFVSYLAAILPVAVMTQPVSAAAAKDGPPPAWHRVDPDAFRDKPAYARKKGTVVTPALVRMIVPGMNKDAVYNLVGTPHFGEAITRKFDYIVNLTASGTDPMRCRMRVVFAKPEHQPITSNHTAVSEVLWQTQSCADRAAGG